MLAGLRVLEIEGLGPGPFCGMLLADLGAEVTVVHRPGGADLPGLTGDSLLDRGKRSIVLDLKDPADRATALALIARSDALIEGFRPGVMERLGLGPAEARAANPALVYGRMTGWGQTGPLAQTAGHDLAYIARSGALWYASAPGDVPLTPPTLVGDIGGGALYLAVGLLAGVLAARATGRGCVVDAAIVDGSAHMMALVMAIAAQGGFATPRGQSLLDGPHWGRSYACACGGHIAVQALEPKFYRLLLQGLGLQDDPDFRDRQFDRSAWPVLTARLAGLFATRPRDHWAALFAGSDACLAPVLSPEEAARDPHIAARGIWSAPPLQPAPAPRFDGQRRTPGPVPARGAHTAEIRAELARNASPGRVS
ncbi:MAG: CaiB/BaiF CoA transferase family protein [Gemmobacter sp.]|uniref:CaiB/BaiF CoA transferase family protein n=1 Tax=Gemmobacter sp. TaxID=1898957 RepID=UPI00391DCEAE